MGHDGDNMQELCWRSPYSHSLNVILLVLQVSLIEYLVGKCFISGNY
jgi:hypothetical protein